MIDFKQQDDGDILLPEDDFEYTSDPARQHQRDIILTPQGSIKASPLTGLGVEGYLLDDSSSDLIRNLRKQLIRDGQTVKYITVNGSNIQIAARYEND